MVLQNAINKGILKQTFSNADATIAPESTYVAQTGTLSAARTLTLPAASSVVAGSKILIVDESGTATSTNKILLVRSGSDTLNGGTVALDAIVVAYGFATIFSDGVSKWTLTKNLTSTGGGADLSAIPIVSSTPTAPSSGNLSLFVKGIAKRGIPHFLNSAGVPVAVANATRMMGFSFLIQANGSVTPYSDGGSFSGASSTTTSIINNASNQYEMAIEYGTGATANDLCYFSPNADPGYPYVYDRGMFSSLIFALPDASYGSGATGSAVYAGWTVYNGGAMQNNLLIDNTAQKSFGFNYSTNRSDTNWQFKSHSGSTLTLVDTGLPFVAANKYAAFFYIQEGTSAINWELRNMTAGTSVSGSTTNSGIVTGSTFGYSIAVKTLSAIARKVRMSKIYYESTI